jgi:hypothetical protein
MKTILRFLARIVAVFIGAAAGSLAGDRVRAQLSGETPRELRFMHTDEAGEVTIALNLPLTHFIPALLIGFTSKPGWLGAFLGGALMSILLGERYEESFGELLEALASMGKDALEQLE